MAYEPKWHEKNNNEVPEKLQDWLFHQASFVTRLKSFGAIAPKIIVLKHQWEMPLSSERTALNIEARLYTLVREVLIKSEERVWMYARTIFPAATLTGRERCFIHMNNRSLGTILFKYPDMARSEFEIACLNDQSTWHQKIKQWVSIDQQLLWARRSLFTINKKKILLSEVFLPDILRLTKEPACSN